MSSQNPFSQLAQIIKSLLKLTLITQIASESALIMTLKTLNNHISLLKIRMIVRLRFIMREFSATKSTLILNVSSIYYIHSSPLTKSASVLFTKKLILCVLNNATSNPSANVILLSPPKNSRMLSILKSFMILLLSWRPTFKKRTLSITLINNV